MVSFRPVTREDLPILADWMARPHWREWWGEPETELGYIRDMIEGRDTTCPFIFRLEGVDKGYCQVWYVGDQQETEFVEDYPWLKWLPQDAAGVDLALAEERDLSRGLGTEVLRAFVRKLRREGHERIVIDPDPANLRAVKAYRKAGFREIGNLLGRTGDNLLMELVNTKGVS
ncbi:GNAT family N-acetyltransferase [Labrenzia sp. OB1]|uniref:GNAT family N-acetyltransferase n=1 Tax=Labrenzia sp. OB1 TaxID=1561204 RepID=UPI0007B2CA0A|nr:GNAT family N-acetyltransferase [Labrenzia sp. OB1]KZM50810.1 GCN5 family acetyltransferase [Labrenzia sp. OB1]